MKLQNFPKILKQTILWSLASISRQIKNIYKIGELEENSTCVKIAQVQAEGTRKVTREIPYYNLDMIISVGYRVESIKY